MRKITAPYIFPVSSKPLKLGIIVFSDDGEIIDLIDTQGELKEIASLEYYPGILVPGFVNAHCHTELSVKQLEHPYWVICPRSNLMLENRLPDIELLMSKKLNIAVGTDSYSFNQNLSILEELKTIGSHYPSISLEELLLWSTLNGAKALNRTQQLGSFEKGKKPGINLITGIDFDKMCLTRQSKVKVLV
jgi:cytosine/adenosine deaminase-related metal-dependent hydrolase